MEEFKKEEYKNIAIKFIKNFIDSLGYNKDVFDYLNDIKIEEDDLSDINACAVYCGDINHIFLDKEYLEEIISDKVGSKHLIITLIHEYIHAIRCVMNDNYDDEFNFKEKLNREKNKKTLQSKRYFLDQYRMLLSDVINDDEFKDLEEVPIKVTYEKPITKVILYNKKGKRYEEYFLNGNFINDAVDRKENLLNMVNLIPEQGKYRGYIKLDDALPKSIIIGETFSESYMRSVENDYINNNGISLVKSFYVQINKVHAYDEILTDSIAHIIYDYNQIGDYDKALDNVIYTTALISKNVGCNYIKEMGKPFVESFLFAHFGVCSEYDDEKKLGSNNYKELLNCFSNCYYSKSDNSIMNNKNEFLDYSTRIKKLLK